MKKNPNKKKVNPKQGNLNPTGDFSSDRKTYSALFFILLLTLFAYFPAFNNAFVWDDFDYIFNNPAVQSFSFGEIFSGFTMGNYHPLTMLVIAIEYNVFGFGETGFHACNIVIHLMNVVLVFYAINLLSDKVGVAIIAALLFGIHPLHVESVAWVSELKDVLYTFFFLLAWMFYMKFIRDHERRFYFFSMLFFLLSILSKGMAVAFPFLLLLTDYFKERKITSSNILNKIPFFGLSIIFGIVAIMAQRETGATDIAVFPLTQRIVFASYGFIFYLYKLIFPLQLSAFYGYPMAIGESLPGIYYLFVPLSIAIIIWVIYSAHRTRNIIFGFGFYAITIFLVLQLIPVGSAIVAERYGYVPSIGIFFLAGEGFLRLWNRKKNTSINFTGSALLGIVVILFVIRTRSACITWKDGMTLWNSVISRNPDSPTAYSNRGIIYMNENKIDEALHDFAKALELKPDYSDVFNNRGVLLTRQGKYNEALKDFDESIKAEPGLSPTYNNRGYVLMHLNRLEESLNSYNKAIQLDERNADAYFNRGILMKYSNRNEEAVKDFSRTIELNPSYADAYFNRGVSLMGLSRLDEAMSDLNNALRLNPRLSDVFEYRGTLFINKGMYNEALNDFNKLIELQPRSGKAYLNRGTLNNALKKFADAIADFNMAISLQPDLAKAYYNKAMIEVSAEIMDSACIHLKQAADLGFEKAEEKRREICR